MGMGPLTVTSSRSLTVSPSDADAAFRKVGVLDLKAVVQDADCDSTVEENALELLAEVDKQRRISCGRRIHHL
jgi:hypothetical protein